MHTESRRRALARQQWMRAFEEIVTAALPAVSGRIQWDAPTFWFNEGLTAADAASKFIERPELVIPRPINPHIKES